MSNKTYDTIKLIALICVPFFAFLASICTIWNVPHSEQITATLTALDTLIGAVVVIIAKVHDKQSPYEDDEEGYIFDDEVDEDVDEEAENAKEESGEIDG